MSSNNIELLEWDSTFLEDFSLSDPEMIEQAQVLSEMGVIEVLELKDGLRITSNSYVGKIRLGDLQIDVFPKLNGMPLYTLMRYSYGLTDLKLFDSSSHSISNFAFFDLLIYELYIEIEDLLYRGINKAYLQKQEHLSSPKGRIDFNEMARNGGVISSKLPCRFYERNNNHLLNQVMLAGLVLAINSVVDTGLKVKLQRLSTIIEDDIDRITLDRQTLLKAKRSINRLNRRYSAILELINILYESQGLQIETVERSIMLRGYFFDMNVFFESLVGRVLSEQASDYVLKDQFNLKEMFRYTPGFNPRRRRSPTPRPDFAIMKNGEVVRLLDAKYRDLWEKSLPRDMLYQLAVYALSGVGDRTSTIIYPSLNDEPVIQKIDISNPVIGNKKAWVILQPINLIKLSQMIIEERVAKESFLFNEE